MIQKVCPILLYIRTRHCKNLNPLIDPEPAFDPRGDALIPAGIPSMIILWYSNFVNSAERDIHFESAAMNSC